jgi:phosphoglycerol transferase MdoB-like AlkP superfamily enzyme
VAVLFGCVSFLAIFTLTAEIEFYKEFQMRLGPLALEYFSTESAHNAIIVGMIWHGYPVVRWILFCLVVWLVFFWWGWRFLRAPSPGEGWRGRTVATVLWISASVVAIRGGFQPSVLRWGDAFFSQNTYANQMTQNGVFALLDTLRHHDKSRPALAAWKRTMPLDQAIATLRETTLLPGETLVEPERYPLLRLSPESERPLLKRPRNVVLVVMESFSARFCGAIGADFGATPQFDELARHGVLFDRAFSVSTHTAQGVFATLCSFPNLPEYEALMKHPRGAQPFRSLPTLFTEAGYETLFLYNGLFSWDNKEGFFRNQGMQRFIGRNDYKDPVFVDPDWGVSDLDVFHRAAEEFSALAKQGKPFLGIVLTLSNHSPFNLPHVPSLNPITAGGEQNKRLNGIHYADWALGQFMKAAQQSRWFDETLFVFVGDHGFGIPPNLTEVSLLHMHVPLLFYGPSILGDVRESRHTVAGQLDILPTIVGLAGLKIPHQSFGRDLFRLRPDDPGHAYVKRSGDPVLGWIEGEEIAVVTTARPTALHNIDLAFPPSASPDLAPQKPARSKEMARRLEAAVVTGLWMIEKKRAGTPKATPSVR